MVHGRSVKRNLNINPKFFFFYNSFINKSTGIKFATRIFDNLRVFRWFFYFHLKSLLHLYLLTFKKFRRAKSVFSWIANKRATRFSNEGMYRSQCNSFKIFKFYLLNVPNLVDRSKTEIPTQYLLGHTQTPLFFILQAKRLYLFTYLLLKSSV